MIRKPDTSALSAKDQKNVVTNQSITREPLPESRKVHRSGVLHPSVRVAMREISLTNTRSHFDKTLDRPNEPVVVYDTSGPYTDPSVEIDVRAGLAPLRQKWILDRGDVEELPELTSEYGRKRLADTSLDYLRFDHLRKPLKAKGSAS
ncbi:MAG TPA: hypothetical protein VK465_18635, partial [Fibrobacteria bacterium]|nr:hypothetical protein [Fibrobacteria bacterium]